MRTITALAYFQHVQGKERKNLEGAFLKTTFPSSTLTVENSVFVLAEGAKAEADAASMDATATENFILKYECV